MAAFSKRHKEVKTSKLKNILKEEPSMANLNDIMNEQEASAEATSAEEQVQELDALLQAGEAANNVSSQHTSEFSSSSAENIISDKTAEDSNKEAQAAARRAKLKEKADEVAHFANPQGDGRSTSQLAFSEMCKNHFKLEALLYEHGPKMKMSFSRTLRKDANGEPDFYEGTLDEDKLQVKNKTPKFNKYSCVKSDTKAVYKLDAPSKIIGGVISMPSCLNVTFNQVADPNITVPTAAEVLSSPRVTIPVTYELLVTYILAYCNGRIKERDAITQNPLYSKNPSDVIVKGLTYKSKAKGTGSIQKPQFRPVLKAGKRRIALKENVLPLKFYDYKEITEFTEDERRTLAASLEKSIKRGKDTDRETMFDTLKDDYKDLVKHNADGSYEFPFLNDPTLIKNANLIAYDWGVELSEPVKGADGKNVKKVALDKIYMPVYYENINSKNNTTTYKMASKTLGDDGVTLASVADKFPVAEHLAQLGVSEAELLDVLNDYNTQKSQLKKRTTKDGEPIRETALTAENYADKFMRDVMNRGDLGGNLNAVNIIQGTVRNVNKNTAI